MYEVLLPVDDDESRANSQAETVRSLPASTDEVHATILHVFSDNVEGASVTQVGAVREASESLEAAGIDVTLVESSGDVASEVLDRADEIDADMVCLAGRKRTPAGKALFGSVTQGVILGTDRPVLVAGSRRTDGE